jgi:hypothetical protein
VIKRYCHNAITYEVEKQIQIRKSVQYIRYGVHCRLYIANVKSVKILSYQGYIFCNKRDCHTSWDGLGWRLNIFCTSSVDFFKCNYSQQPYKILILFISLAESACTTIKKEKTKTCLKFFTKVFLGTLLKEQNRCC